MRGSVIFGMLSANVTPNEIRKLTASASSGISAS